MNSHTTNRKLVFGMLLRSLFSLLLICFASWPSFGQNWNRGIDYADFDDAYPLALAGNVDAQYRVGRLYQYGDGVEQNYGKALKWLSLAAESGHEAAQNDRSKLRLKIKALELSPKIKAMGPYKLKDQKEKISSNCLAKDDPAAKSAPFNTNAENLRGEIQDRNGRVLANCSSRFYSGLNLASHLIGRTNDKNVGVTGIEKSMNRELAAGENVVLSIDIDLQKIVREEIQKQIEIYNK